MNHYPPSRSLIRLLVYTLVFGIAVQLIALGALTYAYPNQSIEALLESNPLAVRTMLAINTIGTFFFPVAWLQLKEKGMKYFPTQKTDSSLFLLSLGFLIALSPVMDLIGNWNATMELPDSLKAVESWMRESEDQANRLTEKLVMNKGWGTYLGNVIVLAALPAICEELFFRAGLQSILNRWFKNYHVAIWVSAVIFSAIHFQFYGFFPRLLLGAVFGYLFVWSRNISIPIFAHFLNNFFVVSLSFYYTQQGKTFQELQEPSSLPLYFYIISLIASFTIGFMIYTKQQYHGEKLEKNQRV